MIKKCIIFLIMFFLYINVDASIFVCDEKNNTNIILDNDTVVVGSKVNINVKSDDNVLVSYFITEGDKNITVKNDKNNLSITGINSGKSKINVDVQYLDNENNLIGKCSKNVDINVISSELRLIELKIDNYDIEFNSDKFEYELTLPYEVESVNISAKANIEDAIITGVGERSLNEGNNSFSIVLKNNNDTNSYRVVIKREGISTNNYLSSLTVSGYVLEPTFDKNKDEYKLYLPNEIKEIEINGICEEKTCSLSGTGKKRLSSGVNTFKVIVTSQSGDDREYKVIVNRSKGNSLLNELKVSNYKLDKEFEKNTFNYNVNVYDNVDKLNIIAIASLKDKVEIIGNENLKYGKNNIYITVSSIDKTTSTYKLVVNKYKPYQSIVNMDNNSSHTTLFVLFICLVIIMISSIAMFIKENYFKKIKLDKKKKKGK